MGKNKRTLIVVPNLNLLGGVSLHYKGLREYWKGDIQYYETFIRNSSLLWDVIHFTNNILRYLYLIIQSNTHTVVINVSLKRGMYSKVIYLAIASLCRKRVVTFMHGWDVKSEFMLKSKIGCILLKHTDTFIVLAEGFKSKLQALGVKVPIYLSTTKVEDNLVENFDITKRIGNLKKFLFLSRVEKSKGIFLTLEIIRLLQLKNSDISLTVAGDGSALIDVKEYVRKHQIKNIHFLGKVEGKEKIEAFNKADCFFLLSESEGMPAALLEAMAFGLPIITTPVGGIPDFFKDGEMGIMSNSNNPKYYCDRIIELSSTPNIVQDISFLNYNYAKSNFYASAVAKKLEEIFYKK